VGAGSGLGAVAFRYLISFFTWVFTGHTEFGQNGYVGSSHLPWLGLGFLIVAPVVGGLIYGPLVYRFAREARGHGVPEVMIAVAENGGRIRPQVSIVKALASALTIGTGGSVGREGPIVQIGSALASTLGQWIRMPENRMRILVACGAGGGIAATFNAPITGVFFGVEIILREISADALFAVMLSAMVSDAVAIPFLGDKPFLSDFPVGIALHDPREYILIAVLAVVAALIGLLFKTVLYGLEDIADKLWRGRPEWLRPAVGGLVLGLILLALPQMYGVGYPVMFKIVAGDYALWFLLILVVGKIIATSVSLAIGGSGGVFGPSLFIGVTSGMVFGIVVDHLFGPDAGDPALYAVVGMGAVFASAARAPLTSFASVVEMTGDFTLTLPVMLAVAIAAAVSRGVSYGTIYTTKLLRRGQDVDRAAPWRAFTDLSAAQVMARLSTPIDLGTTRRAVPDDKPAGTEQTDAVPAIPGTVTHVREPQAVFATESITDVLRQLDEYGRDGLPVLTEDGRRIQGWITNHSAIQAITRELGRHVALTSADSFTGGSRRNAPRGPATPLTGYQLLEVTIPRTSPVLGKELGAVAWPPGHLPVSFVRGPRLRRPDPHITIAVGDRINLLCRTAGAEPPE
jgi:CIC family chloride channel protein